MGFLIEQGQHTTGARRIAGAGLWCLLVLLLLTPACNSLKMPRAHFTDEEDWLTEGAGADRQSARSLELAPPLEQAWIYNANAGFGQGSPLIVNDAVVVATRKGEIHAVDLNSGERIGLKSFGESIEGTPVIAGGSVFVPVAWGGHSVYSYDLRRGDVAWSLKGAPVEAGLLLLDDVLLAPDVKGVVRGVHPRNGSVLWEHTLDGTVAVLASPVALSVSIAAVADDEGHVTAVDVRDGSLRWRTSLGAPVQATPAVDDGRLFVPTTRGRLAALDAETGERLWTFSTPDTMVYVASPAVSDGEVVFGASDGRIRSVDAATGTVNWDVDVREGIIAAPLLLQNTVYVGTLEGVVLALDRRTGSELWRGEVEGRIKSAPAAKGDYLIVMSEPRYVYGFKPKQDSYAESR